MSTFSAPWALCGGWAIHTWMGRDIRDHGDVDIMVFARDHQILFDHLAGWQMVAHDPNVPDDWSQPWDGRHLELPGHIHARLDNEEAIPEGLPDPAGQGFNLDIQLSDRSGDDWVLSRDPRLTIPIDDAIQESPIGLPTVVPEVLLFFKSGLYPKDRSDFRTLRPHLNDRQREWLRNAIAVVGHPWLRLLNQDMNKER